MSSRRAAVRLSALAAACAGILGCGGGEPASRALLIGIDGASPRIVEPLLAAGRLPNLARIAAAGAHGSLRSSFPLLSPRVWTTIATGKIPERHGIQGWVRPLGRDRTRLYYSFDRVGHALWNIVSGTGRSVGVVNWLVTYPPEIVRGVMVSDHAFVREGYDFMGRLYSGKRTFEPGPKGESAGALAHPIAWTGRAQAAAREKASPSAVPNPFEDPSGFRDPDKIAGFTRFYELDQQVAAVALAVEAEERPDLLMVLLQGIDRVSHHLWGGFEDPAAYRPENRFTPEQRERARRAVEDYYVFTDDLIGRLVERFGEGDLVIVVSDHGFEAGDRRDLTGGHGSDASLDGVIFARGRSVEPGPIDPAPRIVDVAPTILAWLGIPLADDMDGAPASFLDVELPERIATYDTTAVPRLEAGDSGADSALLEQLRSLGYIE